jgi:hypothetical protein
MFNNLMKIRKILFFLFFIFIYSVQGYTCPSSRLLPNQNSNDDDCSVPSIIINNPNPDFPFQIVSTYIKSAKPEDIQKIFETNIKEHDVLLSTENEDVLLNVLRSYTGPQAGVIANPSHHDLSVIPLGKLIKTPKFPKTKEFYNKFKDHYHTAINHDPIGVLVLTINTGYDSFVWMHTQNLTLNERTAEVIFGMIIAATFGLNKEVWPNMVRPIHEKVLGMLHMWGSKDIGKKPSNAHVLMSHFISNMSVSIGIQSLRLGIISIDQLSENFYDPKFWGTSFAISSIITFSTFSWNELMTSVSREKYPTIKKILKNFMDFRSLVLGQFTSAGKILNPEEFGYSPWAITLVNGSVGMAAMLNSKSVVNWFENHQWLNDNYVYVERVNRILKTNIFDLRANPPPLCSDLFL